MRRCDYANCALGANMMKRLNAKRRAQQMRKITVTARLPDLPFFFTDPWSC